MGNWAQLWISELQISAEVSAKITFLHGITPRYVQEHFVGSKWTFARLEIDDVHGERWIVTNFYQKLPRVVIMIDEIDLDLGTWRLRTAFKSRNSKIVGR